MKRLFEAFDEFMIRVPYCKKDGYDSNKEDEEYIKDCLNDKIFMEQLLIASPSLYSMLRNVEFQKLSNKKKRNLLESIYKYDMRRCIRATPFGLFSSVGLGKWQNEQQVQIMLNSMQKKIQVDVSWLFEIIKTIEYEYAEILNFRLNGAYYHKGERSHLLYSTENKVEEINMRRTDALKVIEDKACDFVGFNKLVKELHNVYSGVEENTFIIFLKQLIEKEILISDLRVPLSCCNILEEFLKRLRNYKELETLFRSIIHIEELFKNYEETNIGEGSNEYQQIIEVMKKIHKTNTTIQVDMNNSASIALDYKIGGQISELASLLVAIGAPAVDNNSEMDLYRNRFMEKYGMNKEVPILEMMDSDIGIGAPYSYLNPRNQFNVKSPQNLVQKELEDYLQKKYYEAVLNNTNIEIKEDEIKQYFSLDIKEAEIPISLELCLIPKMIDDKLQFYLGSLVGAAHAGKTFGRFAYLSKNIQDLIKTIDQREVQNLQGNYRLYDINFLPAQMSSGNVMKNSSFREGELTLFTSPNNSTEIKIADILVGVDKNKFYVRDKKSGDILKFKTGNMYNYMLTNNIIRFLQEVSLEGKRGWATFPWKKTYKNMKYIPEIRYKNFILQKQYWLIKTSDLEISHKLPREEFDNAINKIRKRFRIPDKVCLPIADNKLFINFNRIRDVQVLYEEFKKRGQDGIEIEAIEEGEDIIQDECGNCHISEIVVPLYSKYPETESIDNFVRESNVKLEDQIILPFSNWLFLKLYTNQEIENELIIKEISRVRKSLENEYGIKSFFMRYLDPKPHIRLRFWFNDQLPGIVYNRIGQWIKEMQIKKIISKCVVDTYEREIERYGKNYENIELAEEMFSKDSDVIIKLLEINSNSDIDLSLEELAFVSILKYLEYFKFSGTDIVDFFEKNYHSTQFAKDYKEKKEKYMELYDIENEWKGFCRQPQHEKLMQCISISEEAIKKYVESLQNVVKGKSEFFDIVSSVLHLHCNRLLGTDRNLELKVMTTLERIVHAKKMKLETHSENSF